MFTRIVVSLFLCLSFYSSASLINLTPSPSGQSIVDKSTNLEWLNLENTFGMTVDQALQIYSAQGWSIASFTQMDQLLSAIAPSYIRLNEWETSIDGVNEDSSIIEFAQLFGFKIISPYNAFSGSVYYLSSFYIGAPFVDPQVTNNSFAQVAVRSSHDYVVPAHEYCYETDPSLPYTCVWIDDAVVQASASILMGDPHPVYHVANPQRGVALVRAVIVYEPNLIHMIAVFILLTLMNNQRKNSSWKKPYQQFKK